MLWFRNGLKKGRHIAECQKNWIIRVKPAVKQRAHEEKKNYYAAEILSKTIFIDANVKGKSQWIVVFNLDWVGLLGCMWMTRVWGNRNNSTKLYKTVHPKSDWSFRRVYQFHFEPKMIGYIVVLDVAHNVFFIFSSSSFQF